MGRPRIDDDVLDDIDDYLDGILRVPVGMLDQTQKLEILLEEVQDDDTDGSGGNTGSGTNVVESGTVRSNQPLSGDSRQVSDRGTDYRG